MEERKKHKVMIGIEVVLLCMLVAILGTNAASSNPPSNGVSYGENNQTTVEGALNDLYNKANYGNATAAQILKGKTALVGGKKVTGTYVAPTCPSLASQTPGDATEFDIAPGKIAWVNGKKIVGYIKLPAFEDLNLGDYISYTPSSTSYTISMNDTGYSRDTVINPSELNVWRVIRKNENGTVDIVSENASSSFVGFKAPKGYKNYIGVLNKIAKSYENSDYTVGSRHIGYDGTAVEILTSIATNPPDRPSGSTGNPDNGYTMDKKLLETAIGTLEANDNYLLASRGSVIEQTVIVGSGGASRKYSVRVVVEGTISSRSSDNSYNFSGSVRPIVVLKSTLKITGGNGTVDSPYTLGL